jgi:hypothetical protein
MRLLFTATQPIAPNARSKTAKFQLWPIDNSDAWHYREIFCFLTKRGELIGGNDLLIAAAPLANCEKRD